MAVAVEVDFLLKKFAFKRMVLSIKINLTILQNYLIGEFSDQIIIYCKKTKKFKTRLNICTN
ncbi:hypothetical protein BpHYR1_000791 [Brachionus plicatilis]|uniref:Uncharacterized protein n=1 Tax=Brachionus plicatilis TaxID=10195 RepID=A0A3M7SWA2_BRAPC|nr:hypothetical protein BpHYR1_000791 [Brachionus plicatilis]